MNKVTYKYWLIYQQYPSGYSLYAYTDRKEYLKEFKSTRRMDLFEIQKMNLTREQIHDLTEEYSGGYLVMMKGRTQLKNEGVSEFSMVMTKNEQLHVNSYLHQFLTVKIWELCVLNPRYLKKPFFDALSTIGYVDAFEQLMNPQSFDIGAWFSDHEPDYLSGFIKLYGDTLKEIE